MPFVSALISVALGVAIYMLMSAFVDSRSIILCVVAIVVLIYLVAIIKLKVIEKDEILMLPKGESIIKILTKIHLV